jgi:putative ABC transport system ATP-binding protein
MESALIQVENLWKVYDLGDVSVTALADVTLEVGRGEFTAIIGASGSGKSTFMNLVGCLDRPTRGRYWLDGVDVFTLGSDERAEIRNRKLGFVFQNFNLISRTSALENVELPLFYGDLPLAEQRIRAREALRRVGLADREHHLPNQLSGGQQQRVAIARALVNRPPLILADEPTGNLDTRTSIEILEVFQELNRSQGITILLVTHEPDIASFARRVITFRDGRVISDVRQGPQGASAGARDAVSPPSS